MILVQTGEDLERALRRAIDEQIRAGVDIRAITVCVGRREYRYSEITKSFDRVEK